MHGLTDPQFKRVRSACCVRCPGIGVIGTAALPRWVTPATGGWLRKKMAHTALSASGARAGAPIGAEWQSTAPGGCCAQAQVA